MTPEELIAMINGGRRQPHVPLNIKLNNVTVHIGQSIPATIYSLEITCGPHNSPIHPSEVAIVKQWLNNVVTNFTGDYASYNGVLIPGTELVQFKL